MTDEKRKRVARAMAGFYGRPFDECPKEKADLRAGMADARFADINEPTQADHLEAADAAIAACEAWEPIETAPRPTRPEDAIIVARYDGGRLVYLTNAFINERTGGWWTGDKIMGDLIAPTHWRHRPTPPREG